MRIDTQRRRMQLKQTIAGNTRNRHGVRNGTSTTNKLWQRGRAVPVVPVTIGRAFYALRLRCQPLIQWNAGSRRLTQETTIYRSKHPIRSAFFHQILSDGFLTSFSGQLQGRNLGSNLYFCRKSPSVAPMLNQTGEAIFPAMLHGRFIRWWRCASFRPMLASLPSSFVRHQTPSRVDIIFSHLSLYRLQPIFFWLRQYTLWANNKTSQ